MERLPRRPAMATPFSRFLFDAAGTYLLSFVLFALAYWDPRFCAV
jgi:hypothetical protein